MAILWNATEVTWLRSWLVHLNWNALEHSTPYSLAMFMIILWMIRDRDVIIWDGFSGAALAYLSNVGWFFGHSFITNETRFELIAIWDSMSPIDWRIIQIKWHFVRSLSDILCLGMSELRDMRFLSRIINVFCLVALLVNLGDAQRSYSVKGESQPW